MHTPHIPMAVRRALLRRLGAAAAVAAIPTFAASKAFGQSGSAGFSWKYATNMPPEHAINLRLQAALAAIREESGGRLDIRLFPANQLGSDTDTLSQLRAGGVELFNLSGLILATLIPQVAISAIGFAFTDHDAVWKAMDGELGAYIRAQIAKVGLVGLEKPFDNGFRQMTSSTRPIRTPEDLQGFKMRVPVSPLSTSLFRALGASPVAINAVELYTALQTGLADGQENPLLPFRMFRLNEVQKHCSLTNHMWDGFWCLANQRAWERLPEDLQALAARHINQAAVLSRADMAEQALGVQKALEADGMVFYTPQLDAFREVLRRSGFYAEWKGKMGAEAWTALENSTGATLS